MNNKPIIVQSDNTILIETESEVFETVRDKIILFSELIKSPDYIHTYKITPLSLWNAASSGMTDEEIISILKRYGKYSIPEMVLYDIKEQVSRFGAVEILRESEDYLRVHVKKDLLFREMLVSKKLKSFGLLPDNEKEFLIPVTNRGNFKLQMTKLGYPAADLAGYIEGTYLDINLRKRLRKNFSPFELRDYQNDAVNAFYADGSPYGGSGTIVLPCGSGKTIIGIGVISKLKTETLIISTNITAIRQWKEELLDKTDINEEDIGEYSGEVKNIKPVTIASYQIITYRKNKSAPFKHFSIFNERNWGLIIYDEVHLLPAPVFRVVSSLQSRRRLGLTATLIREDGLEEEVFALIGPKKFELPWKRLEATGWIAKSYCVEYRVKLPEYLNIDYATSDKRGKFRIASENPDKFRVIDSILKKHPEDNILIIGQYISQLNALKDKYDFPIITGKTSNKKREVIYNEFKSGKIKKLIVSKVANFAVDLPDANVAIQISGTFGSRQEEAQRLGRILRPKSGENIAYFYTVITQNTVEQIYARNRQMFLIEQGYKYETVNFDEEEI